MIRRFEYIKKCGIFEDFRWDAGLPDFQRINLIFGLNGTGKSSLSEALDNLTKDQQGYEHVSLLLSEPDGSNQRSTASEYVSDFDNIYVFSDAFVSRSHNFSGEAKMGAVLTLGQKSVEDEKLIKEIETTLPTIQSTLNQAQKEQGKIQNQLDNAYRDISRDVVAALQRAGGEYRSNGTYNAGRVRQKFADNRGAWKELSGARQKELLAIVNADRKEKQTSNTFSITIRSDLAQNISDALIESPVVTFLDTLATSPEATNWVNEGRLLHKDKHLCIFCASSLSDNRKKQIDEHFTDAVVRLQERISQLSDEVRQLLIQTQECRSKSILSGTLYDDLREAFSEAWSSYSQSIDEIDTWAESVLSLLTLKATNVLSAVADAVNDPKSAIGERLDEIISTHNVRVADHEKNVGEAAREHERHLLKKAEPKIVELEERQELSQGEMQRVTEELNKMTTQLAVLRAADGDPLPSSEVITRELARILGRSELALELMPDGKHYRVTRFGSPAERLSTGEQTAITLIHFLEHVKRADNGSNRAIVVIDDPVSSLDSGVALGISSYIWSESITKSHIRQIFVLTHNFELFRQWDIQIDGLPGKRGTTNNRGFTSTCFELSAQYKEHRGVTSRHPRLDVWPPDEDHRKKVRSTYHHSFLLAVKCYLELKTSPSTTKMLDAQLLLPNALRKMLETFAAFKSPKTVGDFTGAMRSLGDMLKNSEYSGDKDALRTQITRFTHTYSHAETPETDVVVRPEELSAMFVSVFTLMNAIDSGHFEGLCHVANVQPSQLLSLSDESSTEPEL